ncbi:hypothetical protein F4677DRAFT_435810 [Hypoxylon crocopeplum]|nr:hypothetical protein F4677DRAFT_435810 [Hypoxylon crocopeplum]
MYFASILTSFAVVASTGRAAVLPPLDPYIGDLRTFSQEGCDIDNQGVGTFTQSMTNNCNLYASPFNSLYIHITTGWMFRAHNEADCRDDGTIIAKTLPGAGYPIVCNNQTLPWVAYSVYPLAPGETAP